MSEYCNDNCITNFVDLRESLDLILQEHCPEKREDILGMLNDAVSDNVGQLIFSCKHELIEKREDAFSLLETLDLPINNYFLGKEKPKLNDFRQIVCEAYPGCEVSGLAGIQGDYCVLLYPDKVTVFSVQLEWSGDEEEYFLSIDPMVD